jgi:RND family efflux transporter MFP subunit
MRKRGESRERAPGSLRDEGLPCYLQLADEDDFPHEGQIDFASAEVSTSTGTARIRAVFPNKDRILASGLFVRVQIPVSKPYDAIMVPERALATDQNIKFVYVVGSDGAATRKTVELGGQRGDMRIVTNGLAAGDRVIVKGLQRVKPGQKVEAELAKIEPAETTVRKPTLPAPPARTRRGSMPSSVPQPRSSSKER